MKLHQLCDDTSTGLRRLGLPASYLFIEAVIATGALSEAAATRVGGAMQAAMARLRNFMTPGASTDLGSLLHFFAEKGGGFPKLKELVAKAKQSPTPIAQDTEWWRQMFEVFGLKDPAVQSKIQSRAIQIVGSSPTTAPSGKKAGGAGAGATDPDRVAALAHRDDLRRRLDQNLLDQQASQQRLQELEAKLAAFKAKRQARNQPPIPPTTEALLDNLAHLVLVEAEATSSLRCVANHLMRKLGFPSNTSSHEMEWLKRFVSNFKTTPLVEGFNDYFNNLRHMVANPGIVSGNIQDTTLRHQNEHLAKVAIKLLSDRLTQELGDRLRVANLTTKDLATTFQEYQALAKVFERVKGTPQAQNPVFLGRVASFKQMQQRILLALKPELAKAAPDDIPAVNPV